MKVSEYQALIGKPVFNVGDRAFIKALNLGGWVSHIQIQHGLSPKYHYIVVNADDEMIKGHGLYNGFLSDELELFSNNKSLSEIVLEDGKKFYVVFKNPGDPALNLYLYDGKEIDLGDKAFKKFSSLYKEFFKSQGRDKVYEEFYKWVKEELKCSV